MQFWTIPDNPPPEPDCFVIPSYALKSGTWPTRPTRAEIELAYEWWQRFPKSVMIMSTGDNQGLGVTNAAVMADYAAGLGVPRKRIIEEDRSRNTRENLAYAMEIMETAGLTRPTLVTHDLYTRRAVATARALGWRDFHWLSIYSAGEPAYGYKYVQTYSRLTMLLYEMGAMVYSKLVGWI